MSHAHRFVCALLACGLLLLAPSAQAKTKSSKKARPKPPTVVTYAERPDAMALADEIAARRHLDRRWVRRAIAQAVHQPKVIQLVTPSPTTVPKNWQTYRDRFVEPRRIEAGRTFWRDHQAVLARAEREFGVPAAMIVSILGVETFYGRNTGNFRVLDALTTLALDFPASHPRAAERSRFFRAELEHLLGMKQAGIDPLRLRGSYAGAMGLPQFMPSSWALFAVDYDGDGRIDLYDSAADAIGSVANYFKSFNWQPGLPTHYGVRFDPQRVELDTLLAPDILPTFSATAMQAHGALLDEPGGQHLGLLALVELQNGDAPPSYVAGTENFYAITRYNWSSYYAMAVIELARALADPAVQAAQDN